MKSGLAFLLLILGFSLGVAARADDPSPGKKLSPGKESPPGKPLTKQVKNHDPLEFWFEPRRAQPAAVAEMVLAQDPLTVLALRIQGKSMVVWNEPDFLAEEAPPLNPQWLRDVQERDRRPMPNFIGKAPDEIPQADRSFLSLYNQALVHSFWTPAAAFAKSAQDHEFVTFAHMYSQIDRYRGKVIHLAGRLVRLRKYENVPSAAREKGVTSLFEGWIALSTKNSHPVCVIFPLLPEGPKPPDSEHMDRHVEFNGYLICLFRYRSGKEDRFGKGIDLDTPLLIGPTVKFTGPPPPPEPRGESLISSKILYGLIGFVGVVFIFVVGLNWWFHRGDQKIKAHLAQLQDKRTIEMLENTEEMGLPLEDKNPTSGNDLH